MEIVELIVKTVLTLAVFWIALNVRVYSLINRSKNKQWKRAYGGFVFAFAIAIGDVASVGRCLL
ncbi:hypothetical protein FHW69_003805 [Luteibacter sp. Sphag1AF]|nr:hypothetical protein [Luteibacter sp. Sphag1AF]